MLTIVELMSGIYRFLPNTLTVTLMVVGIMLGKVSWILVSLGAVALIILTSALQAAISGTFNWGIPGKGFIRACSILPIDADMIHVFPSLWITMAAYYLSYILCNASVIYTTSPKSVPKESMSVQQRKSIGIVSIVTTIFLMSFIIIPRLISECETRWGAVLGGIIGIHAGIGVWNLLNACGSDMYPDIHGVMLGLKPGALHLTPQACS